jgi:hypothetical protein
MLGRCAPWRSSSELRVPTGPARSTSRSARWSSREANVARDLWIVVMQVSPAGRDSGKRWFVLALTEPKR